MVERDKKERNKQNEGGRTVRKDGKERNVERAERKNKTGNQGRGRNDCNDFRKSGKEEVGKKK